MININLIFICVRFVLLKLIMIDDAVKLGIDWATF